MTSTLLSRLSEMTPSELIAALENPSDQTPADVLNEAFALAVGWKHDNKREPLSSWQEPKSALWKYTAPPDFLTSIDTVLREMPEGWELDSAERFIENNVKCWQVEVSQIITIPYDYRPQLGTAPTIQRALMAAILRAMA